MPLPPSFLQEGHKYRAKVITTEQEQNFYRLELAGNFITAFSASELVIGETVTLEVLQSGSQPLLRIITLQQESPAAVKLLNSCRLPVTADNLSLMEEYLAAGKPVQFNEIISYFQRHSKT